MNINITYTGIGGMYPRLALADLKLIFLKRERAVQDHMGRSVESALTLFTGEFLPLLIFFPLFSLISPYRWITGKSFKISTDIILPLVLVLAFMGIAALYDKIMEHSSGPGLEGDSPDRRKNISLFLHLPLMSCSIFYFIHPLFGLLMIFAGALFSIVLSVRACSIYRYITPARALVYYGWSIFLGLIPVFIFFVIVNIIYSIDLLGDL